MENVIAIFSLFALSYAVCIVKLLTQQPLGYGLIPISNKCIQKIGVVSAL